jgi:hypothetical protein
MEELPIMFVINMRIDLLSDEGQVQHKSNKISCQLKECTEMNRNKVNIPIWFFFIQSLSYWKVNEILLLLLAKHFTCKCCRYSVPQANSTLLAWLQTQK